MAGAENRGIQPSVKSPFSLKADYANPGIYGWAALITGILGLVVGIIAAVLWQNLASMFLVAVGIVMIGAGYLLVTRAE